MSFSAKSYSIWMCTRSLYDDIQEKWIIFLWSVYYHYILLLHSSHNNHNLLYSHFLIIIPFKPINFMFIEYVRVIYMSKRYYLITIATNLILYYLILMKKWFYSERDRIKNILITSCFWCYVLLYLIRETNNKFL